MTKGFWLKNAKVAIENENETDGGGGGGVDWNHLQRIHMAYQKMLEQNRKFHLNIKTIEMWPQRKWRRNISIYKKSIWDKRNSNSHENQSIY